MASSFLTYSRTIEVSIPADSRPCKLVTSLKPFDGKFEQPSICLITLPQRHYADCANRTHIQAYNPSSLLTSIASKLLDLSLGFPTPLNMLSILLVPGVLHYVLAAASPPLTVKSVLRHEGRLDANPYAFKYQKSCGGTFGRTGLKQEALDTAQTHNTEEVISPSIHLFWTTTPSSAQRLGR